MNPLSELRRYRWPNPRPTDSFLVRNTAKARQEGHTWDEIGATYRAYWHAKANTRLVTGPTMHLLVSHAAHRRGDDHFLWHCLECDQPINDIHIISQPEPYEIGHDRTCTRYYEHQGD